VVVDEQVERESWMASTSSGVKLLLGSLEEEEEEEEEEKRGRGSDEVKVLFPVIVVVPTFVMNNIHFEQLPSLPLLLPPPPSTTTTTTTTYISSGSGGHNAIALLL